MNPFYLGESSNPVYGVLHEPSGGDYRQQAVLLCHPLGHEYYRSYRMLRVLATTLSELGYYVMRFDYRGTGDSSGSFDSITMATLIEDIKLVSTELQAMSGQRQIIAVGVRMGAALLLQAQTEQRFEHLALWDPCLNGADYWEKIKRLGEALPSSTHWFSTKRDNTALLANEYIGHVFSNRFSEELQQFDAAQLDPDRFCRYTLVTSSPSTDSQMFDNNLERCGCEHQFCVVNDMGGWEDIRRLDQSITTQKIIDYLSDLLK